MPSVAIILYHYGLFHVTISCWHHLCRVVLRVVVAVGIGIAAAAAVDVADGADVAVVILFYRFMRCCSVVVILVVFVCKLFSYTHPRCHSHRCFHCRRCHHGTSLCPSVRPSVCTNTLCCCTSFCL